MATAAALFIVRSETRQDAIDSAYADADYAAERAAIELGQSLALVHGVVARTAANPALGALLEDPAVCNLSFASAGVLAGSINVVKADGTVACSSSEDVTTRFGSAPWFESALSESVATPFSDPQTGEAVFVIAEPMAGVDGVFIAVLDLAPIGASLGEQYGGPRSLEFLVADPSTLTVLSRSIDSETWAGTSLVADQQAVLGDGERPDLDGTVRLYGTAEVATEVWTVYAGADKAAALAGADQVSERFSLAIGAGLVVALLASAGVYLLIIRPVRRLTGAITKAAREPTTGTSVDPQGPAEIRALAAEFNRMTQSVQDEFRRREQAEAERDRLRQQLGRIERLESLGQLAGGMAHDFNNMLGVMLNYATFVKVEVNAAATQDSQRWGPVVEDIEAIEDAVHRSSALTRQLLAFARCDVSRPATLQVNDTISELSSLLQRTIGENIRLDLSLAESLDNVEIDPGKLQQVLVNLAGNARDAMSEGGTLAIDTSSVDVDQSYATRRPGLEPGRYVRIRVSDTGTGMDPRVAERAFEPLFTTKSAGRGTGLGLSTVYGIVSQAGGDISIYSEVGQGTTFSILLPAASASAQPVRLAPTTHKPVTLAGSETVILVEDDHTLLEVSRRILVSQGYRTLIAADGQSAIAMARSHPGRIELLVTDMVLPDMSGRELADILLAEHAGLRVVYASGYAAPILSARNALGPNSIILEKPFPAHDLLSTVRMALAS